MADNDLTARRLGYIRRSAKQLGIPAEEYLAHVLAGRKWCIRCRAWHAKGEFGADPHKEDGLNVACKASYRVKEKNYFRRSFKHTEASKAHMSLVQRGIVTPHNNRSRANAEYQQWRRDVFKRDNRTCIMCGSTRGLHAHHLKSFNEFPELRFDIDNGQTLCRDCHESVHAEAAGRLLDGQTWDQMP